MITIHEVDLKKCHWTIKEKIQIILNKNQDLYMYT